MLRRWLQWVLLSFVLFIGGIVYLQSNDDWIVVEKAMSMKEEKADKQENILSGIQLQSLQGDTLDSQAFLGKKVFVFFFTSWCQVCAQQWEEVISVQEQLENVAIVAVNLSQEESSTEGVKQYLENIQLGDIKVVLDTDGQAQQKFRILGIPTSFVLNEAGQIATRSDGFISGEQLIEKINRE